MAFSNPEKSKEYARAYQVQNREKIRRYHRERYAANREKILSYNRTWRERNIERVRENGRVYRKRNLGRYRENERAWRLKNPERAREISRTWRARNPEVKRAYQKQRRACDPIFKLIECQRCRIRGAIRRARTRKSNRTLGLLGCTGIELKAHLEKQFKSGMTWNNYGEWHVDHICPCASFNLSDPEQQKQCFHFTNLQPLWAAENIRKSDRIV